MTEKRYILHETKDFGNLIEDTRDGRCLHFMRDATEELNYLYEENQELRKYMSWQDMELGEMEDLE